MKHLKIKTILASAAVLSLVSCLKENEMTVMSPDNGKAVIEFANTGNNYAIAASTYPNFYTDLGSLNDGESAKFNINVRYSGAGTAPEDITVNLALDDATLAQFNDENGTDHIIPPTSVFTFPSTVVIKKGTNQSTVEATVTRSADYDFSSSYGLPIVVKTVSSGTRVSSNFGKAVYTFGVRNIFDGHYSIKGYTLRAGDAAKTGNFTDPNGMDLQTVGATANQFGTLQVWADLTGVGIGNPVLQVNADNTVTISSPAGATNAPGYESRYDPSTKTFYISMTWGAGPSARLATDTLTYEGPR
jgi:hypothetical protein